MSTDNWRQVRFGDVVRQVKVTTKDPGALGLERVVGLEHLEAESLSVVRWRELADMPDGTSFTRVFRAGQVLFGKRRAYQRKVAVTDFDGICSGDILVFEPMTPDMLPEFLPYIVQSDGFFEHALGTSAGSLSPRTNWRELAKYEFMLPPVPLQKEAAELFAQIAASLSGLAFALSSIDQVRAALIASVADESPGLVPLRGLVTSDVQGVQVGPFGGSLASKYFKPSGVPVVKINNITADGRVDLSDVVFISEEHAASLDRYRVRRGDVVTAAQGATVGRTGIVGESGEGAVISQHVIRVRVSEHCYRPELLTALFNSPVLQRQIGAVRTKTTRDGLNTADVESFMVPMVPKPSQDTVVAQLARLDECAALIAEHHAATVSTRRAIARHYIEGGGHVQ
jgi:type I restriction enzyme, S subunit